MRNRRCWPTIPHRVFCCLVSLRSCLKAMVAKKYMAMDDHPIHGYIFYFVSRHILLQDLLKPKGSSLEFDHFWPGIARLTVE
jgi:hypothetical protein